MRTGDYRRFFDNLDISYPANVNKSILEKAYNNYWKYSKIGDNNVYYRLPLEIKEYISAFVKIPGFRGKIIKLRDELTDAYQVTLTITSDLIKLQRYHQEFETEIKVLKLLRRIAVRKTIKSFIR